MKKMKICRPRNCNRRNTMKMQEAIEMFQDHQRANARQKTIFCYQKLLQKLNDTFSDRQIETILVEEIYNFLEQDTALARSTRHLRYAQVKAFFNYIINRLDLQVQNPCNAPMLAKSYRMPKKRERKIIDKETVDEMIYNTKSIRDRLILELQARCGLRIGELLKLKVSDVSDRKLTIREPKSGKDEEWAYMPEQIANRVHEYIQKRNLSSDDYLFPICYSTARALVKKLGKRLSVTISPHDLRRHSATYASRNGVPLEIVSKVILRHQDLKTTQIYLGQ